MRMLFGNDSNLPWIFFYERRNSAYELIRQDQKENLRLKEKLCETAQALSRSNDIRAAIEKVKELQAEWKTIGSVPREYSDSLWNTFRSACDSVFERARKEFEKRNSEWGSRILEVISRKRHQIESLRDSILHDQSNISRWEEAITGLYKSGKAVEMREMFENKIQDVKNRIKEKEDRISELEASIRDMESRLQNIQQENQKNS